MPTMTALNDPTVECCGRDAASCDCSPALDMSARYAVATMPGVAFRVLGFATEDHRDEDQVVCPDEDCDHGLSEMCWAPGDEYTVESDSIVRAVMVGDDRVHLVDVDDLTVLAEDGYCGGCGQVGCGHG